MKSRQAPLEAPSAGTSLIDPVWHVAITTERSEWEPPPHTSPTVEADAETLGIDLRLDPQRCVARFFTRGASLGAATDAALGDWELIRRQLGLPDWSATALTVSRTTTASASAPTRTGRGSCRNVRPPRAAAGPSQRSPYYLWSPF